MPLYQCPPPAQQVSSTLEVFDRRILYNYFVAPTEEKKKRGGVSGLLATVSCHHAQGGKISPVRRKEVELENPFSLFSPFFPLCKLDHLTLDCFVPVQNKKSLGMQLHVRLMSL